MITVSREIVISRPVGKVFSFLLDGTNNKKWRPEVINVKLRSGRVDDNAEYMQEMTGPFGFKIAGDYKVTHFIPNGLIRFNVIAGPAHPIGTYVFASEGSSTRVGFILKLRPRNFIVKLFLPLIKRQMEKEMDNLTNLKRVLEQ